MFQLALDLLVVLVATQRPQAIQGAREVEEVPVPPE